MKVHCYSCDREAKTREELFDCTQLHHEVLEVLDEIDQTDNNTKKISDEEYIKTLEVKRKNLEGEIEKNFRNMYPTLEVCLSVKTQLLIDDITQPFALFIMGVPSSLKSTTLEIINCLSNCYKTDKFTPRSFVSHSANVSKTKLSEIDLLPKIRHKTLITPELAPLFTGNEETLVDTFGILARVLDGRGYYSNSGVHGQRGYAGDYYFVWLGAVVDIPHKVWRTVGNLGAKWYYLRIPEEHQSSSQKIESIKKTLRGPEYTDRLANSQIVISEFWSCIEAKNDKKIVWDKSKDDENTFHRIVEISLLLSKLRASIPTWYTNDPSSSGFHYNFEMPIIEDPSRASSALYNLARGHAVLFGRNYITKEDLGVVIAVALSSAERERVALLKLLLENDGSIDVDTFVTNSKVSENTARKEMQKMKILGLVNIKEEDTATKPKTVATLKDEFEWFRSPEFQKYWNKYNHLHTPKNFAESKENAEKTGVREEQAVLSEVQT